ncbi:S9 family peptidase [Gemmatimonadota bacterium]
MITSRQSRSGLLDGLYVGRKPVAGNGFARVIGLFTFLGVALGCEAGTRPEPTSLALTLEDIHRNSREASSAAISPDGEWIAVSASGPEGGGIYLLAADGGEASPTFWVQGSSPRWSLDGEAMAFTRSGEIWTARVGSEEPSQLTQGMESARNPVFSPDGETVAFYSGLSGAQDIWLVPADGQGEPRQLTREAMALDDSRFEPAWSPDGLAIAYVSNASDYWHDDVWLVEVRSGATRQLSRSLMASSTPVWSPDGSRITLFGTSKSEYWYQDLAYIYLLDPDTGDERIVEMQVYATDAIMRHRPLWSDDGRRIYFPYQERGNFDLWSVGLEGGVATRVTNIGGAMSSVDATPDGSMFAFVRSGPTSGRDVFVLSAMGGPARQVSHFATRWEGVKEPVEISFESFDGLHIQGFLFLPDAVEGGASCPALVQVHGGGTNSYLQGLNLTEQYLASRGFVVMAINYRGGSGFGRAFQDLSVEDWLNAQALDAGAAADFLRTLPYTNGKVGIYGGSYGGSMSMAAITLTPDKFDAAVPMRGAYSKTHTLEFTDRLGKIFTITSHGGTPEERPEIYAKSNTVDRISNITAPVLLMHGELDRRVPIQHFQLAVEELEKYGKEYETKTYPTEGHGFRNPDNRIDIYRRLEEFFRKHLGSCQPSAG